MKHILLIFALLSVLILPVHGQDFTAPTVPKQADTFMPEDHSNFGAGLLEVLQGALLHVRPDLKEAASVCLSIVAVIILLSVFQVFSDTGKNTAVLAANTGIGFILFRSAGSLVNLAGTTVFEISEYGKLLLPVMTAAMAGQGSISSSAAIYAGTAFFDAFLTSVIAKILTPCVYLYLALAVANCAVGEQVLAKLRDAIKWAVTWSLKAILYIYTGYIGITGVISGTTDAAAMKAAKLAISGFVPVVGGILSDASEAVLISTGTVKNAAGIYGLFAILAIWIGPFLKIGSHYLLIKATGAVCSVFSCKSSTELVQNFGSALGLLLGMTGAICLMLLISLVCFMKGVG